MSNKLINWKIMYLQAFLNSIR